MAAAAEPPRHDQGLPVLIIGAGSCGLAIAHGLKKAGASVPYRVFEQDPSAAPRKARDWAIGCHWSAAILADLLGPEKWARIAETQTDPHRPTPAMDTVPVVHGTTGDIVRRLPFPRFYRLLRSRLRAFMADGIDVAYAKKLVDITYAAPGEPATVTAHFADGTAATGRLLLGADGGRSRVRSLLLGPERAALKRLPLVATFINCSGYTREQALYLRQLHPVISPVMHPDGMIAMVSTLDAAQADRPETWTFAFYISWQVPVDEQEAEAAVMGPRERLRQSKEKSRCFAEPIRSAYEWMPDDLDTVYYTPNANWDPSLPEHRWDNHAGLVTLVGDAAHPMTYHRGQGFNHALEDAGRIVKLLVQPATASQSELIDEYEKEMCTRAGEEVRLSETNSYMMHDWDRMMQSPLMTTSLAKAGDTSVNGHRALDE